MELRVRNVIDALHRGTGLIKSKGVVRSSRGGPVIELPEPVYTVYERPRERVIFSPARDANPFLHFFESLWMLQGREDLKFLEVFTKNFRKYSDDGVIMQGSYGFRWLHYFGFNQVRTIISLLQEDPDSRRAVLTMWDPKHDLCANNASSDIPCNTHVYFKIRDGKLHMTVNNRSNDMIWGAYGANAVHMSMLHEYVAGNLGIEVGMLIQQSDSFHVYTEGEGGKVWTRVREAHDRRELWHDPYFMGRVSAMPMMSGCSTDEWDHDLRDFFYNFDAGTDVPAEEYLTPYFRGVVVPMYYAFTERDMDQANKIESSDWRKAATEWLERRQK